jgi:NADH dehydrogenase
MPDRIVTVFGGTGFLGGRIVRRLREEGMVARIAARRARQVGPRAATFLATDIRSDAAVAAALAGAYGAVNAVSLYVERGADTFAAVHVAAAERIAREARRAGLERLVHVSGIGADPHSPSPYIRSRGQGERAVKAAFADATIVRPAVMFGRDDALITTLTQLIRRLPALPSFGKGRTRLQPASVDDVALAIVRSLDPQSARALTYELGGPRVYTYTELLGVVAARLGRHPLLLPVPFALWHAAARIAEILPGAPLTRGQVALMQRDSTTSPALPGFGALGIEPKSLESELAEMLAPGDPGP